MQASVPCIDLGVCVNVCREGYSGVSEIISQNDLRREEATVIFCTWTERGHANEYARLLDGLAASRMCCKSQVIYVGLIKPCISAFLLIYNGSKAAPVRPC